MKTLITKSLAALWLITSLGVSAQTSTEKTQIANVDKLVLTSDIDYILIPDTMCSIEIKQDLNSSIKFDVKDGELTVYKKGKKSEGAKVYIRIKTLSRITADGSTDIKGEGEFRSDKLEIISSGSSDIKLNASNNETNLVISGAGDVNLTGSTNQLNATLSGAGDFKGNNFVAQNANVVVSGAGDARVNSYKQLIAVVSGAGTILYSGKPADVQVTISGAGSVQESIGTVTINTGNKSDTTKLRLGNKKFLIIGDDKEEKTEKEKRPDTLSVKDIWKGFELGVNGYLTPNQSFDLPTKYDFMELNYGKSYNLNLNIAEKHIKLYKNYVALTTGLGFEFNKYTFNSKISLQSRADSIYALNTGIKYKKNSLNSNFITAPLFLEFNTNRNENKSFHFAAGVVFGYNIGSKTKQVFNRSGDRVKEINHDNFNQNPFKYSAAIRLGYDDFNIFATYALSDMFLKNKGPELNAFTVGITLIPF